MLELTSTEFFAIADWDGKEVSRVGVSPNNTDPIMIWSQTSDDEFPYAIIALDSQRTTEAGNQGGCVIQFRTRSVIKGSVTCDYFGIGGAAGTVYVGVQDAAGVVQFNVNDVGRAYVDANGIVTKALSAASSGLNVGFGRIWKDSENGKVYLAYNDGGTIKKVELT